MIQRDRDGSGTAVLQDTDILRKPHTNIKLYGFLAEIRGGTCQKQIKRPSSELTCSVQNHTK
jgi:hypothetical protein